MTPAKGKSTGKLTVLIAILRDLLWGEFGNLSRKKFVSASEFSDYFIKAVKHRFLKVYNVNNAHGILYGHSKKHQVQSLKPFLAFSQHSASVFHIKNP